MASKKQRRQPGKTGIQGKVRRIWRINPRVRVKASSKSYHRARVKRETEQAFEDLETSGSGK